MVLNSQKRGWLYNIIVPSSDAYKKKYQWWGVVELLRRAIILLFAVALPGMEVNQFRHVYQVYVAMYADMGGT